MKPKAHPAPDPRQPAPEAVELARFILTYALTGRFDKEAAKLAVIEERFAEALSRSEGQANVYSIWAVKSGVWPEQLDESRAKRALMARTGLAAIKAHRAAVLSTGRGL